MTNKIKALHVTGFWSANFYYRGFLPAMANGWHAEPEHIDGDMQLDGEKLVAKMNMVDVVQFQRPNNEHIVDLMKKTKQKGKIIVFDDDDTFKLGEGIVPQNDEEIKFGHEVAKARREALITASGVTCTTEFLARELREVNPNVCVLPNCIDPDDAGESDENTTGRPRILILGSVISNDDYYIAKKAIEKIADKVTIVLMGVPENGTYKSYDQDLTWWRTLPHVEEVGFRVFGDYYNTIQSLAIDLVIAPRADNYFNRCKSNLKFLESSLFGLPFIGQAFEDKLSPYQINPKDADYLKLAQTEEDWCNILEDFLKNPEEYKQMGERARDYVCEEYAIQKHAHKWEEFYKTLM